MPAFVIREWNLVPYPGDQAPVHVHHRGDEAFYVLDGASMSPEIDRLVTRLHSGEVDDMEALWAAHHSSLVR